LSYILHLLLFSHSSHLVTDACTRTGIPLLYPSKARYYVLLRSLRFTTGPQAEEVLFTLLAISVFLLLLTQMPFHSGLI
jgi:membrane-bound metal-dependent hydrolase YbcI (DUF457 family)